MAKRLLLSMLLLALYGAGVRAEKAEPLPPGASLESRLEFQEDGPASLVLKLDLPVRKLVFRREGDGYRASLRTAVTLRVRRGGLETGKVFRENLSEMDFAATRDRDGRIEREYRMDAPPGNLDVEVLIYGRGPYLPWKESFPVEVPLPGSRTFYLQGPRFELPESPPMTPPFGFFDPWDIPTRHSIFLDGFAGGLGIAGELEVWDATDSLEVILRLEQRDGRLDHYERRVLPGKPGIHPLHWTLPVEDLSMGPHRVTIDVLGGGEKQRIQGKLEMGLGPPAFGRDWPRTLQLISLAASPEEVELMESAEPGRRRGAFLEFWRRREEDPGGALASMRSFFRDLDYVGKHFGTTWTPGWRSDRGRIYLRLGPPRQVDRIDEEAGYHQREVWTYADGRVFVFEDRRGQGDFELVDRWNR